MLVVDEMQNYEIKKTIGEGAFGQVLLATNLRNGADYAIKKIRVKDVSTGGTN